MAADVARKVLGDVNEDIRAGLHESNPRLFMRRFAERESVAMKEAPYRAWSDDSLSDEFVAAQASYLATGDAEDLIALIRAGAHTNKLQRGGHLEKYLARKADLERRLANPGRPEGNKEDRAAIVMKEFDDHIDREMKKDTKLSRATAVQKVYASDRASGGDLFERVTEARRSLNAAKDLPVSPRAVAGYTGAFAKAIEDYRSERWKGWGERLSATQAAKAVLASDPTWFARLQEERRNAAGATQRAMRGGK